MFVAPNSHTLPIEPSTEEKKIAPPSSKNKNYNKKVQKPNVSISTSIEKVSSFIGKINVIDNTMFCRDGNSYKLVSEVPNVCLLNYQVGQIEFETPTGTENRVAVHTGSSIAFPCTNAIIHYMIKSE